MEESEVLYNVVLSEEQFESLQAEVVQLNERLLETNIQIGGGIMFLVLLCVFQFYGLLRRAVKKGGV